MSDVPPFPLTWPQGWPRTKSLHRKEGTFRVGFAQSRKELLEELRKMGVARNQITISSNLMTRQDGLPYAPRSQRVEDPGIAVYFSRRAWSNKKVTKKQYVVACDRYVGVSQNLRSISKTIEAMRSIKRWGATSMLERAFNGFEVLTAGHEPEQPTDVQLDDKVDRYQSQNDGDENADEKQEIPFPHGDVWWEVLGFDARPNTLEEAEASYRLNIRRWHPDLGGSDEAMSLLNQAISEAREAF